MEDGKFTAFEIEFYKETGHMHRHFSTVRLAISTTGFASFFTMAAYSLINTTKRESLMLLAFTELSFCLIVIVVAMIFTIKANQAKKYMIEMEDAYYTNTDGKISGPYTAVAARFDPLNGNALDSGAFLYFTIFGFSLASFIYQISSL